MKSRITSQVVQQLESLPENLQRQVLGYIQGLQSEPQVGAPATQMLKFAGSIESEELEAISSAIEDGCEKVDANEW